MQVSQSKDTSQHFATMQTPLLYSYINDHIRRNLVQFIPHFDFRQCGISGPLPGTHLYECNIPRRAVSDGAPLTILTSTCHSTEPEAET